MAQFTDLFAVMLLVAAVITFIAYELGRPRDAGNLQLAVAILAVVLLNAVIGFGQEFAAERTAEALRAMVPRRSVVLRDGERVDVPAVSLVVGDILVLEAGDAVPPTQVIEAHGLTVDNSALTGESEPARRTSDAVAAGVASLDASNRPVPHRSAVRGGLGDLVACGVLLPAADEIRKAVLRAQRRHAGSVSVGTAPTGPSHAVR